MPMHEVQGTLPKAINVHSKNEERARPNGIETGFPTDVIPVNTP